jgi:predicted GNAT family acetyltransferase
MTYEVTHNAEAERYEIRVVPHSQGEREVPPGELAGFTEAHPLDPTKVLFPHTIIDPAFEGQGLASKLVAGAFDDIRARGLTIVPTCPYILGWLPKHPEYHDLLAEPLA